MLDCLVATVHCLLVWSLKVVRFSFWRVNVCFYRSHYNCDSTTIRLRYKYDDTTTHSTTMEVIEITIRLRYDYDKTTTKNWHVNFLLASNGNRRARYVVVVSWPISRLRFDYDKTTIRRIRRYHDAFDYDGSDRNYDSTAIRLRQDYDEKLTLIFFARVEWKQARANVVVVS